MFVRGLQDAGLKEAERGYLVAACKRLGLSARAWHRVIRVARTIADLAGDEGISRRALAESLTYRHLDLHDAKVRSVSRPWSRTARAGGSKQVTQDDHLGESCEQKKKEAQRRCG